jgi:hypothetical protein
VIIFKIDGRTIKRGALIGQLDHLVPLGVGKLALHFRPSAQSVMSEIWARGTCTARIYDYRQAIGPTVVKKETRKG